MTLDNTQYSEILHWLKIQAHALGFNDMRVSDLDVSSAVPYLQEWLNKGHHGQMHYMRRHANLRENPKDLHPGVIRSICFRMDYLPMGLQNNFNASPISLQEDDFRKAEFDRLNDSSQAVVSIYARGRDYHKILRKNLQILANLLQERLQTFNYRVFVDSAPVMEVELATKAGLGWRGKHTLNLNSDAGSMYFLGEIFVDIPLPIDEPVTNHCGTCQACIDICPTKAIIGPYQLDATKCISYLTIENDQAIPIELRELMGNRIYGCDDCQLICPWNKFAKKSLLPDFDERNRLGNSELVELFSWSEEEFYYKMQGSAIHRIGYERWMRNIAVALGNYLRSKQIQQEPKEQVKIILHDKLGKISELVDEHILWALDS